MFVCFQYISIYIYTAINSPIRSEDPAACQGPVVKKPPLINGKYITIKISTNAELA